MSNPLLRPNDPRFQKPDVRDAEGKNRFGETAEVGNPASSTGDVFAAAAAGEARPFEPRYEAQQRSRAVLWLFFGGIGWGAGLVGLVSLLGLYDTSWISPLLGLIPGGAGWLLAYEELKAIRTGAIASEAAPRTRHALWLGFTAVLACGSLVVAMVYRDMTQ
jgi:hypothetical protein